MPIPTTTIGAYPKPTYVPISDWFAAPATEEAAATTQQYAAALAHARDRYESVLTDAGESAEALLVRATREAVRDQVEAGIDVPTDGEARRENYIHYHCRHVAGFDFERIGERLMRGHYVARLPTITGPISAREPFLPDEWRIAQSVSERPIKVTMPGPMTIADTAVDEHYGDPVTLGRDLATALNAEVLALAAAGCTYIQIDEPVMARAAQQALDHGIDNLARCFDGVPEGVTRVVHVCLGYPDRLDSTDYPKAPRDAYLQLGDALDAAGFDQISFEDAHQPNDLAALLPRFRSASIVLGVVAIAKSEVETVARIRARLATALEHIEPERLIAAPDCGLGFLGRDLALAKLCNMTAAARSMA